MNWQDILKTVAPTVASALLGPMGGIAVTAIGNAIGIDSPTQDKIAKAFTAGQLTPEAMEKIKLLELDYQNQEKERGFKYAELAFKDVDSARQMQIATPSIVPAVLTYLLTLGFFGVLGAMFIWPEVKESSPLMIMLGSLGTAWTGACGFWFGTTHSSGQKNAMLAAK